MLHNKREASIFPFSSTAYRLPPIDASMSRLRRPSSMPLHRNPLMKSHSLPRFSPPDSFLKPRTESEREAAYSLSPSACSGRSHWRSLLDSPSTFGREHGTRFGPDHHRMSFKESPSSRVHPYARASYATLEQRSKLPATLLTHPETGHSRSDDHDKHWYSRRSSWESEPSWPSTGLKRRQLGERQEVQLPRYDHELQSSRFAHSRPYHYRWSVPHEDIQDYYRSGTSSSSQAPSFSYRSNYSGAVTCRGSNSSNQGQGTVSDPYWRRCLSYDEGSKRLKSEQEEPRAEQSSLYLSGQTKEQTKDTNGKASVSKSAPAESAPTPRRGGKLPKHITDMLKTWLLEHADHPYPTEDEKLAFCDCTGLDICQISNWFVNARRRILAPQQQRSTAATNQAGRI